jgi:hypothetical protein
VLKYCVAMSHDRAARYRRLALKEPDKEKRSCSDCLLMRQIEAFWSPPNGSRHDRTRKLRCPKLVRSADERPPIRFTSRFRYRAIFADNFSEVPPGDSEMAAGAFGLFQHAPLARSANNESVDSLAALERHNSSACC